MQRRYVWLAVGAAVICACGALAFRSYGSGFPALERHWQVELGPEYHDPDVGHRVTYYLKGKYLDVVTRMKKWQRGSGSSIGGIDQSLYGWASHDDDEAWMVYPGRITVRDYPYLGNPVTEKGNSDQWTTVIYRPSGGFAPIRW